METNLRNNLGYIPLTNGRYGACTVRGGYRFYYGKIVNGKEVQHEFFDEDYERGSKRLIDTLNELMQKAINGK